MLELKRRHVWRKALTRSGRRFQLLAACIAVSVPLTQAVAQPNAKWVVLRHNETGHCWTALVVEREGVFRRSLAQTASVPYATKAEAEKRQAELAKAGTCQRSETQ